MAHVLENTGPAFAEHGTWSDATQNPGDTTVSGARSGVYVGFDATSRKVAHMKVGVSYVSVDGARANLDAELAGGSFDDVRQKARDAWEEALGRARVDGGTDDDRSIFYIRCWRCSTPSGSARWSARSRP